MLKIQRSFAEAKILLWQTWAPLGPTGLPVWKVLRAAQLLTIAFVSGGAVCLLAQELTEGQPITRHILDSGDGLTRSEGFQVPGLELLRKMNPRIDSDYQENDGFTSTVARLKIPEVLDNTLYSSYVVDTDYSDRIILKSTDFFLNEITEFSRSGRAYRYRIDARSEWVPSNGEIRQYLKPIVLNFYDMDGDGKFETLIYHRTNLVVYETDESGAQRSVIRPPLPRLPAMPPQWVTNIARRGENKR